MWPIPAGLRRAARLFVSLHPVRAGALVRRWLDGHGSHLVRRRARRDAVGAGGMADGLPVGLQIVGRWHADGLVLRAAAAFEAIQPWAHRVVDAHNVEATVAERVAKSRAWPAGSLARVHAARVRRLEMALVQQMDAVIACSGTDAAELARMGARAVHVVLGGSALRMVASSRRRPALEHPTATALMQRHR